MKEEIITLELDFQAAGQLLESLADRLWRLETLDANQTDEDVFADAKNDAIVLQPLYKHLRNLALTKFGLQVIDFAPVIRQLDALYDL